MRTTKNRLAVGNRVSLNLGARRVQGEIVEDRGPIAAGGKHLYRVKVTIVPDESLAFEMPEDEMVAVANGSPLTHR